MKANTSEEWERDSYLFKDIRDLVADSTPSNIIKKNTSTNDKNPPA